MRFLPHPVVIRRLRSFIAPVVVLAMFAGALASCSKTDNGPSPRAVVLAGEKGLTVAQAVARPYLRLPTCTGANGPLCSTVALSTSIKQADREAYVALVVAQGAVDADPDAKSPLTNQAVQRAQTALSALTAIVASLPQK